MSTAQQALVEAEQRLQEAKEAARAKRVEDAKAELKQLRANAKKLRKELAAISAKVREGDMVVSGARAELYQIDAAMATLKTNHNKDLLADPAELEQELAELAAYREEVLEKLKAGEQLTAGRMHAIEIAQQLEHMQFVAANLMNLIEHGGILKTGWQSSLTYVG